MDQSAADTAKPARSMRLSVRHLRGRLGAQLVGTAKLIDCATRSTQSCIADAWPEPGQSPIASAARRHTRLNQNFVDPLESFAGSQLPQTDLAQFGMRSNLAVHVVHLALKFAIRSTLHAEICSASWQRGLCRRLTPASPRAFACQYPLILNNTLCAPLAAAMRQDAITRGFVSGP
jgi:hypothetical protein